MVLRKPIVVVLIVFLLSLISCLDVANEITDWTQITDINKVDGETHFLGDDGIKLFLPTTFKRYSMIEYLRVLDSIVVHNKDMKIERTRLKYMRELEDNHYIYFDKTTNATNTLNTIPYLPITRQDAKFILGIVRQSQEQLALQTDLEYKKITAKHNDNGNTQIFKAIFKITETKKQKQGFKHPYYISSNNKTVLINLMAPFEASFDQFLEKMIL
ncbi:hypothetical protein [Winogradskyella sp. UBA3174]|uniref:hypothetical protein n=1 Tax=Winogradskyella sp. UBA3174 TaxID=1947785 RepID=UPI0025F342F7|nr:hypothetical protein [Winogradskyella sp. UBA3174]|tara:strand:+ start:53156 stop:53800 length:645 start_codon:yes stop_codon:yes gene_type:complete